MPKRRQAPPGTDLPNSYDYEGLKRLGHKLGRPASTLIALAFANDPFYIYEGRRADAKWFANVWRRFVGDGKGIHLRRLHYLLMSQRKKVLLRDGTPYINSYRCWARLCVASKDARYLNLVPMEAFVDRRNPEAIVNLRDTGPPETNILHRDLDIMPKQMPGLPELTLDVREPTQRYQLEIWAEKTTMNDILEPLGERYGIHVVTGAGELSITACDLFIQRVKADGRPLRILYVSDFDPAGQSMPVAVARKIEFMIYDAGLDFDVQVRPVVLTPAQCEQYDLPRSPIKESERRGAVFEAHHGEGATELDALEALHPGELERILEREIVRYWDDDLSRRTREAAEPVRDQLGRVNARVHRQYAQDIRNLRKEYAALVAAYARWVKQAEPVSRAIEDSLQREAPDMSGVQWPEPDAGDEDPNPLFDSTRDYVEQIDRYKEFQGKPTERRPRTRKQVFDT